MKGLCVWMGGVNHSKICAVNPLCTVAIISDTNPCTASFITTVTFSHKGTCVGGSYRNKSNSDFKEIIQQLNFNFLRFTAVKQYPRISGWL